MGQDKSSASVLRYRMMWLLNTSDSCAVIQSKLNKLEKSLQVPREIQHEEMQSSTANRNNIMKQYEIKPDCLKTS